METPLGLVPHDHPTLLEQIPIDICTCYAPVRGECDPHELSESTRVVVSLSLRVTKRLQDRIRLEDLPLKKTKAAFGSHVGADTRNGGRLRMSFFHGVVSGYAGRGHRGCGSER